MTTKCLFAHTAASYAGGYPPYVNLSVEDGELILWVRSAVNADGTCGASASIKLPRDEAVKLRDALLSFEDAAR